MARQVLNYHDVVLYESDVALFSTHQWLNDSALNFYLQYLAQTVAPSDVLLIDPTVVSCLLFQCEDDDELTGLAGGLSLQDKQLCLIPVTDNSSLGGACSHWSLLVYQRGHFRHLDSSGGHNQHAAKRIAAAFERLLGVVGRHEADGAADHVQEVEDAPQQQNGFDCGVYVLVLAEYFCRQHKGESVPSTLKEYATPGRVTELRMRMPALIEALAKGQ